MSERDDVHREVFADRYDPRDRPFPPDDLQRDETLERAENDLRDLLREDVETKDEHVVTDYRELADPTWYQRGEECVGFALAAIAEYHLRKDLGEQWGDLPPAERADRRVSRRMMYEMAQVYDRADHDEGSTLRGALKGWRKTGAACEDNWPYDPDDEHGEKHGRLTLRRVIDAVRRPGSLYLRIDTSDVASMKKSLLLDHPLFVSSQTHVGWINLYLPDQTLINQPHGGKMLGGHAYVIVGFDERGWWIHNSWGQEWGDRGYALLPYADFAANGQDVWFVHTASYARQIDVAEADLIEAARRPRPAGRPLTGGDDPETDDPETDADATDTAAPTRPLAQPTTAAADAPAETPAPPPAPAPASGADAVRPESYSRMWRHLVTIGDDGLFAPLGTSFGMNFDSLKTMLFLFRQQTAGWSTRRLAIFADGGYFSTSATVDMLAPLRDELVANEIYPIFLLWDTPWYADMQGRLYGDAGLDEDDVGTDLGWYWNEVGGPPMAKFLAAAYSVPTMWNQVRRRAEAACGRRDGAARLLAKSIAYNLTKNAFELHLIGHGAGDLVLSRLAQLLATPIRTCNLWSPLTTIEHFRTTYQPMLESGALEHMTISTLDDDSERADTMGPLPGSAALLVSNVLAVDDIDRSTALELHDGHLVWQPTAEPVLGLERFVTRDDDIARIRRSGRLDIDIVSGATHTGLPNDRPVRNATITEIRATAFRPSVPPSVPPPTTPRRPAQPYAAGPATDPLDRLGTTDPLASATSIL
ncbi:MAG: C1 family peptidase [Ilumatobacter sp.]|nr:C1 family peptidase [Ilumatobacter sp.]